MRILVFAFVLTVGCSSVKEQKVENTPEVAFNELIEGTSASLNDCYASIQKKSPIYRTEIIFTAFVKADGEVEKVVIVSNKNPNEEFESCIKRAITKWPFPIHRPPRAYKVTQGLMFEPRENI
ncbi:MAG: AgmX/PglI C-terminal domain-containing protein [Bdellovibrionales bacterium]|nr:AgmX/PglI C-terminal domain-containing protein [Bdellovibrionales bacterium]